MKNGDLLTVSIASLDHFGRGITHYDNLIIFVDNALPKEEVLIKITKVKKKMLEARVVKYLKKSSNRVEPICPYYLECGGCDLMHLNYEEQLRYKENKVKEIMYKFARISDKVGKIKHALNYHYRNKVVFKVNNKIGFYKKGSNDLVAIENCYISDERINKVISLIKDTQKIKEIMIRASKNTNDVMLVVDGILSQADLDRLRGYVTSIYIKTNGNLKNIFGHDACYEVLGNYVYKILPDAFFQVNTDCALMLYNQVLEYLDLHQDDVVLDLYCGAGSIGIYISDIPKKILGVEVNADAFESAIVNAKINDISKIDFMCAKVEDIINSIDYYPNKIIVDPPRSGLDQKTIEYLNQSKAEILVYVSCDPVTLARDLKLLNNYEVLEITPFDMFSQTYHVECVVKLCHKIDK